MFENEFNANFTAIYHSQPNKKGFKDQTCTFYIKLNVTGKNYIAYSTPNTHSDANTNYI